MIFFAPPTFDHIVAVDGQNLKVVVAQIGGWNMDTDTSKQVATPLTMSDIFLVGVDVQIIEDTDPTIVRPLNRIEDPSAGTVSGGISDIDSNFVTLSRTAGGLFDSTDFDNALINRGYISFWYFEQ